MNFSNISYSCVDVDVFNLQFDINNGSNNYEYSINELGYSPINGNHFNVNFNTSVEIIYLRDIGRNKNYKFLRDLSIECEGFPVTTSTTTVPQCTQISSLIINGSTNVTTNSVKTYSIGSYNGSNIISYLWQVDGGTMLDGNNNSTANVIWDGGETSGRVTLNVTNCDGTKVYFRRINIS